MHMLESSGQPINGTPYVIYDRENWWAYHRGEYGRRDVKRIRLQNNSPVDVTGHRYVRVDKRAGTVAGSDSPDGPWEPCPLAADYGAADQLT